MTTANLPRAMYQVHAQYYTSDNYIDVIGNHIPPEIQRRM